MSGARSGRSTSISQLRATAPPWPAAAFPGHALCARRRSRHRRGTAARSLSAAARSADRNRACTGRDRTAPRSPATTGVPVRWSMPRRSSHGVEAARHIRARGQLAEAVEVGPPSGVAEVGRPTEVIDHDPQLRQLLGELRHHAQLVARGLDGDREVVGASSARCSVPDVGTGPLLRVPVRSPGPHVVTLAALSAGGPTADAPGCVGDQSPI